MTSRRAIALVAAVALVVLAAWWLTRGVEIRSSTGGLLTAPVPTTRIVGGWLVGAAAAVTAAVLLAMEAAAGLPAAWAARRRG